MLKKEISSQFFFLLNTNFFFYEPARVTDFLILSNIN